MTTHFLLYNSDTSQPNQMKRRPAFLGSAPQFSKWMKWSIICILSAKQMPNHWQIRGQICPKTPEPTNSWSTLSSCPQPLTHKHELAWIISHRIRLSFIGKRFCNKLWAREPSKEPLYFKLCHRWQIYGSAPPKKACEKHFNDYQKEKRRKRDTSLFPN